MKASRAVVRRCTAALLAVSTVLGWSSPARALNPPTVYDNYQMVPIGSRSLQLEARIVIGEHVPPVALSAGEAELLAVLARRPDRVFTRPELLAAVFDPAHVAGTVDTYVYYLRRKLGRRAIRTVYGVGYQLGTL